MRSLTKVEVRYPADVRPYVVGIWRFREVGRARQWYATYTYRGHYYDAAGGETEQDAIDAIRRGLKRLRAKKR